MIVKSFLNIALLQDVILIVVWVTVYTRFQKMRLLEGILINRISAVKHQRSNWDGPSLSSLLYSKHFKEECFTTEGVQFREALGVPV